MRHRLLNLLALAGLTLTPPSLRGSSGPDGRPFAGPVTVTPLNLSSPDAPAGEVTVRSAVALTGGSAFFGLSALAAGPEGSGLLAVNDAGTAFHLTIEPGSGRLRVTSAPLPIAPDDGPNKPDRDSESMTRVADAVWIGFERRNELRRYSPDLTRLTGRYRSSALAELPDSSGLEALASVPGHRLIGLAESVRGDGRSPAFLWRVTSDGRISGETRLWFRPPPGMRATDAVWLDHERQLLVLVRGFSLPGGFHSALVAVPLAPTPGFGDEELGGRVIARFGPDWDNLEGLSVTRTAGRTIVWLVSDDNGSTLQRTVLASLWLDLRPDRRL